MSASTSESPGGGNRAKAKSSSGWRAFDLSQRRKQLNIESADDSESAAYPLLSGPPVVPQSLLNKNGVLLEKKPFSSVVVDSMNFPSLLDTQNRNFQTPVVPPTNNSIPVTVNKAYQKLKFLHSWAEETLILDVLAGVNNNIDEALSLLQAMLISDANTNQLESSTNHFTGESSADMSISSNDIKEDESRPSVQLLDAAKYLPIEPEFEFEQDDVYLIYRKDAIRMTRSASRHSKAANDAYLRGDHTSALRFSLKTQEDWTDAEKLNAKAAKEILTLRNHKNDPWTLDLHGLHSAEAVEALRERLQNVENLVKKTNYLATSNGVHKESGLSVAASVQSNTSFKMENFGRHHPSSRHRPMLLQVITGKGNHSRGEAALPSAIRSFLTENRYHFDETRAGVIMIRPKLRY
ncbi:hypothetical protein ABFX02_08G240500 [Erythranthe guttata]